MKDHIFPCKLTHQKYLEKSEKNMVTIENFSGKLFEFCLIFFTFFMKNLKISQKYGIFKFFRPKFCTHTGIILNFMKMGFKGEKSTKKNMIFLRKKSNLFFFLNVGQA